MTTYDPYLTIIEDEIQQFIDSAADKPDYLYNMIKYHMGWIDLKFQKKTVSSAKRLRPLLLVLCCEALSTEWHSALPAAVAVELLHNFTLIHDDIEDRDEMRRGRPTVWTIWGVPQAINAGDALYALSYRALLSLQSGNVKKRRVIDTVQVFTDAIQSITEGQCLDIGFEKQNVISETDYLGMIAGKTAALFGLSCELGAIVARAEHDVQRSIKDFGIALGMAFQMQDDILGLWGDTSHTGKPVGSDLNKRKKTLPIIHCAQQNSEFQKLTAKMMSDSDIEKAMELLETTDSYKYTENKANLYLNIALDALDMALDRSKQLNIHPLITSLLYRQR